MAGAAGDTIADLPGGDALADGDDAGGAGIAGVLGVGGKGASVGAGPWGAEQVGELGAGADEGALRLEQHLAGSGRWRGAFFQLHDTGSGEDDAMVWPHGGGLYTAGGARRATAGSAGGTAGGDGARTPMSAPFFQAMASSTMRLKSIRGV